MAKPLKAASPDAFKKSLRLSISLGLLIKGRDLFV
jgi:hypothetical protein